MNQVTIYRNYGWRNMLVYDRCLYITGKAGAWVVVLFCFVLTKASDLSIRIQSLCLELYGYTETPVML